MMTFGTVWLAANQVETAHKVIYSTVCHVFCFLETQSYNFFVNEQFY